MFGLLNIHKPSGPTSRRIVDQVLRLVRPDKVGHAGTLDPLASGVLVVCIGPATRLIEYVQQQPKTYHATFLLGQTSTTEDIQGDLTELADPPRPSREQLVAAAAMLTGTIEQRPPAFSALKVGGRRAYALARAGESPDLAPRPVTIYRLEVLDYCYPRFELAITCSGGTYVRSLGRDLAERLGSGAVMSALVRTAIGQFTLDSAVRTDRLTAENIAQALLSPLIALPEMRQLAVDAAQVRALADGRPIADPFAGTQAEVAAVDERGALVALLAPAAGMLRPTRSFAQRD